MAEQIEGTAVIPPPDTKLPSEILHHHRLILAVTEIGECLADLGMVLRQSIGGVTDESHARIGSIAAGLIRAATHVRNEDFAIEIHVKHLEKNKGTTG